MVEGQRGQGDEVAVQLPPTEAALFATALGLANWHVRHPRCPRCGTATEVVQSGWVRRCSQDGSEHYPRTDPAVIMAVTDGHDRLLLARNVGWPEGRFSVLAGFLEPGETIAGAVARARATAVPASETLPWLISAVVVGLLLYYFIGVDEGAVSVFGDTSVIHEFVHDARHFLGFPCH